MCSIDCLTFVRVAKTMDRGWKLGKHDTRVSKYKESNVGDIDKTSLFLSLLQPQCRQSAQEPFYE